MSTPDPTDKPAPTDAPKIGVGRADYHDRREARADRLEARADKARAASSAAFGTAGRIASAIPMGQPILVGHHSERRHRRDIDRIDRGMRRGIEEERKAANLERRADAARANDAISSDDPNALERLADKLAALESTREQIKATSKAARRGDADARAAIARAYKHAPLLDPARGVPSYVLRNLGAEIRRVRQRIATIEAQAERTAKSADFGRWHVWEDPDDNRTRLQTTDDSRATPDERRALKSHGFRWAPSAGAWQRKISNGAWHWACDIAKRFGGQS